MNNLKIVDTTLTIFSSVYSLATIEQTLSIIILVINILWIVFRIGFSVYKGLKEGKDINEIEKDVSKGVNDLESLKKGDKE